MYSHGFGHGLTRGDDADDNGPVYDHNVVVRMLRCVSPYRPLVAITIVTMLIYSVTLTATPWLIGYAIDAIVAEKDLRQLNFILLILAGNAIINYIAHRAHLVFMTRLSQNLLYDLRTQMFNHLQSLSLSFFDRNEVGRLMSRVQNDVQQLQEFLSIVILSLADVVSLTGIIAVLIFMNFKLAVISLTVLPILALVLVIWQGYARRSFQRVRKAIAVVNGALQENLSGVRVVQSLSRERINLHRFDHLNRDHLEANLNASRLSASLMPMAELLMVVGLALVVVFGSMMVLNDTLLIGALIAFALYIQRFFDPIRNLTMQYAQLQRAMASGQRIFQLLDIQADLVDVPNPTDLSSMTGAISFKNVNFGYHPNTSVLQDVNLQIQPGQTIAIVGPTGAGKSTLVALISRLYDVTSGQILLDNHDVRQLNRRSLMSQMSVVLQEPFLFSATIRENIRYCHLDVSDEVVEQAARAVGAHNFITQLENGYNTILSERGGNLSMGQRQLLSFARALAGNPRILILDEATANVDTVTELKIQEALKVLLAERTAIVIAHRLSTVRNADMILVMDNGKIVERGSHSHLLTLQGLYSQLYSAGFHEP